MTKELIQASITAAMRARDAITVSRLKMVLAAIQTKEATGPVSERGVNTIIQQLIADNQGLIDKIGTSHPKSEEARSEIAYYLSLIPAAPPKLSRENTRTALEELCKTNNITTIKDKGRLLGLAKQIHNIDMEAAHTLALELLQ